MDPLFEQLRARLRERPPKPAQVPGDSFREAAVLAPFVMREDTPHLLFTKRPKTLRAHAGQFSFPGGSRDPDDPTPLHTALRETEEELGISPRHVEVLGMLDELPTITGFRIQPFVGVVSSDVVWLPNPEEVELIVEVPLRQLIQPSTQRVERWTVRGAEHDVYFFDYGPHVIWGATAQMVRNLLQLAEGLPAFEALR